MQNVPVFILKLVCMFLLLICIILFGTTSILFESFKGRLVYGLCVIPFVILFGAMLRWFTAPKQTLASKSIGTTSSKQVKSIGTPKSHLPQTTYTVTVNGSPSTVHVQPNSVS